MRILYNGIPLLPPRTGVGRYLDRLSRSIVEVDPSVECDFIYAFSVQHGLRGRDASGASDERLLPLSRLFFQRIVFTPPFTRVYPYAMDAIFPIRTFRGRYDLYHETNYVPRPFRGPTVVTVYDLSLVLHPETHPRPRVYLFERDFVRRIPRVDRFLAISQSVKEELIGAFNVESDRVTVTQLGVDPAIFHPEGAAESASAESIEGVGAPGRGRAAGGRSGFSQTAATSLPTRYILFVGSLEPRKNLTTLFRAYARLPAALREAHPIVLAGPVGWKFDPVWEEVRTLGLEERVFWRGFVSESALATLYRGASAFAFPSIYEGFGLPILEAMASGTPVVCSDIPSLTEVVGDAALRVPARDVEAWSSALESILEDEGLRGRLRAEGLRQAARFSWRRCAEETLAVYRELT